MVKNNPPSSLVSKQVSEDLPFIFKAISLSSHCSSRESDTSGASLAASASEKNYLKDIYLKFLIRIFYKF